MKKTVTAILLAGIVITQVYWVRTAYRIQETQAELQAQHESQLSKEFNDRVTIALTNVAEDILSINQDPSMLFEAVKQIRSNYFYEIAVTANKDLQPFNILS